MFTRCDFIESEPIFAYLVKARPQRDELDGQAKPGARFRCIFYTLIKMIVTTTLPIRQLIITRSFRLFRDAIPLFSLFNFIQNYFYHEEYAELSKFLRSIKCTKKLYKI